MSDSCACACYVFSIQNQSFRELTPFMSHCYSDLDIWIPIVHQRWGFRILSRYEWTGTTDKGLFKSTSMTISRDVRNICMFRDHYAMMNSQLTLRKEKSICWLKKRFRGYSNKNLTFPTNRHCLNPILKSSNEKVMISSKLCFWASKQI